jgi:hypothetical protein
MSKEILTPSEAVYGVLAWLTTRKEAVTLSSKHDAAIVADLARHFCETNNLEPVGEDYHTRLIHPDGDIAIAGRGKNADRKKLISDLLKWLGKPGVTFFTWCKSEHGEISPCYIEHGFPHPVHLREGMTVRNFLNTTEYCRGKDIHWLDNNWAILVEEALNLYNTGKSKYK